MALPEAQSRPGQAGGGGGAREEIFRHCALAESLSVVFSFWLSSSQSTVSTFPLYPHFLSLSRSLSLSLFQIKEGYTFLALDTSHWTRPIGPIPGMQAVHGHGGSLEQQAHFNQAARVAETTPDI